jgi:hypothetical protein
LRIVGIGRGSGAEICGDLSGGEPELIHGHRSFQPSKKMISILTIVRHTSDSVESVQIGSKVPF